MKKMVVSRNAFLFLMKGVCPQGVTSVCRAAVALPYCTLVLCAARTPLTNTGHLHNYLLLPPKMVTWGDFLRSGWGAAIRSAGRTHREHRPKVQYPARSCSDKVELYDNHSFLRDGSVDRQAPTSGPH